MSIQVRDLCKSHQRGVPVLRGISFDVKPGTLVAILGRSGAGKSTLLRCLNGLDDFDSGALTVGGITVRGVKDVGARQARAQRRSMLGRVGMVFQSFELFPHLTVLENCVLAPVHAQGQPLMDAQARARQVLAELAVADKEAAYPSALSGGQKQRVAMARALCLNPTVVLYDEPTSALDAFLKDEVRKTLLRIRDRGVTQLMVVHDLELCRRAADQVVVLSHGQVVEQGPPDRVLEHPEHAATVELVHSERGVSAAAAP